MRCQYHISQTRQCARITVDGEQYCEEHLNKINAQKNATNDDIDDDNETIDHPIDTDEEEATSILDSLTKGTPIFLFPYLRKRNDDDPDDEEPIFNPKRTKSSTDMSVIQVTPEGSETSTFPLLLSESEIAFRNVLVRRHFNKSRRKEISDMEKAICSLDCDNATFEKIVDKYLRYQKLESSNSSSETEKMRDYMQVLVRLPFRRRIPLTIEGLSTPHDISQYLAQSRLNMDDEVYGLVNAKEELLTILATMVSKGKDAGSFQSLAFQGDPGVGKTSLAKSIGKILGVPLKTVNLGGRGDSAFLLGHRFTYVGAQPGAIVNLMSEKDSCSNMILYFDELDKISTGNDSDDLFNILIHLIDRSNNEAFVDNYLDIPIDLSKCIFIFSYNNESKIDPILLDRLKKITISIPSIDDKLVIARQYLIPRVVKALNFGETIVIDDDALRYMVNEFCIDKGMRSLISALETLFGRLNLLRLMANPHRTMLSFHLDDYMGQDGYRLTVPAIRRILKDSIGGSTDAYLHSMYM